MTVYRTISGGRDDEKSETKVHALRAELRICAFILRSCVKTLLSSTRFLRKKKKRTSCRSAASVDTGLAQASVNIV